MKSRFIRLVLVCLGFLFSANAIAGKIKQVSSRAGVAPHKAIVKTQPTTALNLFDQEYGFMVTNPLSSGTPWTNTFNVPFLPGSTTERNAYCNVVLRYDESRLTRHTVAWSIEVDYEIKCWEWNQGTGTFVTQTYSNESLTIDYDPATPYTDKVMNRYKNCFGATVVIKDVKVNGSSITGALANTYKDVFFDLEQETERYYVLGSTAPAVKCTLRTATNELELRWNFVAGAESYDVEWVFIDINDDPAPNTTTEDRAFDFHNATRINVPDQHCKISLAFPKGILLYRVRGVAAAPLSTDDYSLRQEGAWSFYNNQWAGMTVADAPYSAGISEAYRKDIDGLHPSLNWQYAASYAEDGKRKEVISFFDGSLRNRQTLTLVNTESTAIVGESKYDYSGRAAVQILPAPVASEGIRFYNNFNPNFDRTDFDQDANVALPGAMPNTAGAGYYYSTANTNPVGYNGGYTPDAEGYPYIRTRFATDGTNRPVSISSPGATHKTGSGKETKFFYGSPSSQDEIDQLFGNEAGNSTHYQKNMVRDANGQVSIAYIDQYGRTVATALAGDTPDNLIAVDNQPDAVSYTMDLLSQSNYAADQSAMISSVDLMCVASGTVYTFDYSLDEDTSCSNCFVCKSCLYDLEIAVMDEFGNYVPGATIITSSCSASVAGNPVRCEAIANGDYNFTVTLDVGKYKVVKRLSISESAIDEYEAEFLAYQAENLSCPEVNPLQPASCSFACTTMCEQQYKMTDDQGNVHYYGDDGIEVNETDGLLLIQTCINNNCSQQQSPLSECEMKRNLLLIDMSPGGQYFENVPDRFTLDVNNDLIDNPSYDPEGWLTSNVSNQTNFWLDFTAFVNDAGEPCGDLDLTLADWDDVRANWQDCFAEFLITYHPEYCAYNYFCNHVLCTKEGNDVLVSASNDFNSYLLTENDQADAESGGLFSTFGHATNTTYDNTSPVAVDDLTNGNETYMPYADGGIDPYFDCDPVDPLCASNVAGLVDEHLSKFYPIPGTSPQKYLSIWYVINDPAGIHLGNGSPDAATLAYFENLHGTSSTVGILYDPASSSPMTSGQISRWTFYRSVYLYYKNLIYYSGLSTTNNCPGGLLPDSDMDGYTDIVVSSVLYKGFQIRYPENPIYEVYVDNYNDILCTADPLTETALLEDYNETVTATTCETTCEAYASAWIEELNHSCTLSPTQQTDIANYLTQVCQIECGTANPMGTDGCSTCPGTPCDIVTGCVGVALVGNPSIVFYDFEDVITYFTSSTCTATIVHPLTGDEGACSCRHFDELIDANFPSSTPTNQEIADLVNLVYNIPSSQLYSATDIANWKAECAEAVPSNADLDAIDFPDHLKCFEDEQITPEYNAGICECENVRSFISALGLDASNSADMPAIVAAVNAYLAPSTAVTSTDIGNWMAECDGSSIPSHDDFVSYNLPVLLQCPVPASTDANVVSGTANLAQCQQNSLFSALGSALAQYHVELQEHVNAYTTYLRSNCLNSLAGRESFTVSYTENQYLYTLYYYDQAGNLVKTVPPEGVDLLTSSEIDAVQDYRKHPEVTANAPVYPEHRLVTRYKYNSLQQMIESESPDGGLTLYWYDALGRPVLSQNARQAVYHQSPYSLSGQGYSYVKYDGLGRVIEGGELLHSSSQPMTRDISRGLDASITLDGWMSSSSGFREITYMFYDEEENSIDAAAAYGSNWQDNLRNRVSSVWYVKDPAAPSFSGPDAAQYYSYDIHGNVKTLVVETNVYDRLHYLGQNLKQTDYEYDLVSGNVNAVKYQEGQHDQFYHRYEYDADNRLKIAFTSHNGIIWEKESKAFFYAHGSVARMETGDKIVQGTDYAYTIQGWIKGVNSNTLVSSRDIGKDGNSGTNLNRWVAYDAMGYSLGYFTNDYKAITSSLNNTTNSFTAVETTETNDYVYNSYDLYNGNISRMVSVMRDASGNAIPVLARSFRYDQLNRIKEANAYGDNNVVTNNYWSNAGTNDLNSNYQELFTYDWNGNIKTAQRNGDLTTTHQQMDDLDYDYNYDVNGYLQNNKLKRATDGATALSTDYGNDIDAGQAANNYQYDHIGNLVEDASEEIENIEWNNQGKISKITRTNTSDKSDLEFLYNAMGQRVVKIAKPRLSGVLQTEEDWVYTIYSRDGSGNVLAVYDYRYEADGTDWKAKYDLKEQHIYGASRLGMYYDQQAASERGFTSAIGGAGMFTLDGTVWNNSTQNPVVSTMHLERELGNKAYELSNHLGNVLSVVSDRRLAMGTGSVTNYFLPEVMSYTDYYAFGMSMPGRTWVSVSGKYRYDFNGKETDEESDLQDYGMRIYNAALGRFLSVDPWSDKYPEQSPYVFAHNCPVALIDWMGLGDPPDGDEECCDEIPADAAIVSIVVYANCEKNEEEYVTITTYAKSTTPTAANEGEMTIQAGGGPSAPNETKEIVNFSVSRTDYWTKKSSTTVTYNEGDTEATTSTTTEESYSGYTLTSSYDIVSTYYSSSRAGTSYMEYNNGQWEQKPSTYVDGKGWIVGKQKSGHGGSVSNHSENTFIRGYYSELPSESAGFIQNAIDIRTGKLTSDGGSGRTIVSWPDLVLLNGYAKSVSYFLPDAGFGLAGDGFAAVSLITMPPPLAAGVAIGGWAFQKMIAVQESEQGKALFKQYNNAVYTQSTKGNWGAAVYKIK